MINYNIFSEVQDRHSTQKTRLHNSLRTLNNAPQKTRNFCCFFIAYSAFPNLKTYGKISQNQERKFLKMKNGLKNIKEKHAAPLFNFFFSALTFSLSRLIIVIN